MPLRSCLDSEEIHVWPHVASTAVDWGETHTIEERVNTKKVRIKDATKNGRPLAIRTLNPQSQTVWKFSRNLVLDVLPNRMAPTTFMLPVLHNNCSSQIPLPRMAQGTFLLLSLPLFLLLHVGQATTCQGDNCPTGDYYLESKTMGK